MSRKTMKKRIWSIYKVINKCDFVKNAWENMSDSEVDLQINYYLVLLVILFVKFNVMDLILKIAAVITGNIMRII